MPDTPLEILKRQLREGEERLKRTAAAQSQTESRRPAGEDPKDGAGPAFVPPAARDRNDPTRAGKQSRMDRLELRHPDEMASIDWVAFGQMTPAILKELSQFISSSTQEVAQQIGKVGSVPASLERLVQNMVRVGASLAAWADSAAFLSDRANEISLEDLLQEVLAARRPELERWGIRTAVQIPDSPLKEITCPRALYLVLLYIIQSCVEEIQESAGTERLVIRVQQPGERVEVSFVYDISGFDTSTQNGAAGSTEHLRDVELRAAQKLLDPMGGSLVLENIGETQRAIRLNINLAARSSKAVKVQSQGGS